MCILLLFFFFFSLSLPCSRVANATSPAVCSYQADAMTHILYRQINLYGDVSACVLKLLLKWMSVLYFVEASGTDCPELYGLICMFAHDEDLKDMKCQSCFILAAFWRGKN